MQPGILYQGCEHLCGLGIIATLDAVCRHPGKAGVDVQHRPKGVERLHDFHLGTHCCICSAAEVVPPGVNSLAFVLSGFVQSSRTFPRNPPAPRSPRRTSGHGKETTRTSAVVPGDNISTLHSGNSLHSASARCSSRAINRTSCACCAHIRARAPPNFPAPKTAIFITQLYRRRGSENNYAQFCA